MGRRKSGEVLEEILQFLSKHPEKKFTIQDISRENNINWDSTDNYVALLTDLQLVRKNEDGTYQKTRPSDSDTFFGLPMNEDHKYKVKQIYKAIKQYWPSGQKLTKTHMQKAAVKIVENMNLDIPRGWYRFGEILLLPPDVYVDDVEPLSDKHELLIVEQVCNEYALLKTTEAVRRKQYNEKGKLLYKVKEDLNSLLSGHCEMFDDAGKMRASELLNEFAIALERKSDNSDVLAVVDNYCSTVLGIIRNSSENEFGTAYKQIMTSFYDVWNLVTTYELKDSLRRYYGEELLKDIFDEKIRDSREMAIESLENLYEYKPKFKFPNDEKTKRLLNLAGSARELKDEEKEKRAKEAENMSSEELGRKFGLN